MPNSKPSDDDSLSLTDGSPSEVRNRIALAFLATNQRIKGLTVEDEIDAFVEARKHPKWKKTLEDSSGCHLPRNQSEWYALAVSVGVSVDDFAAGRVRPSDVLAIASVRRRAKTTDAKSALADPNARFALDYLDELLAALRTNRWCFRDTCNIEMKISEHAKALGLPAPFERPSKPEHETAEQLQIWLKMHDPVTDARHERLIETLTFAPPPAAKGTVLKMSYRPLDEREQAEFRQFVDRLKRELNRRAAILASTPGDAGQRGGDESSLRNSDRGGREAPARAAGRRRRRQTRQGGESLTAKQLEAVQVFGDCESNYSATARKLGISLAATKERVRSAYWKLGQQVPTRARTERIKTDLRGGVAVSGDRRKR
jgi:hypothetical protein